MEGTPTQQTAAEPASTTADRSQSSAPAAASSERPQLASFSDALTKAPTDPAADASKGNGKPSTPNGSDASTDSTATVQKFDSSTLPSDPEATETDVSPEGDSAPGDTSAAPKPDDETSKDGKGTERPSRRGAAEIAKLTTERDDLATRVQQLEALTTVPDDVKAAMTQVMLPNDIFDALDSKKRREDISGDYLTPEESQQYNAALQVREWFAPVIAHERQQASAWVNEQRQGIFNAQAEALAPVLRARDYLKPDVISRSDSWTTIYDHLCDASHAAGRSAERSELQPKLDEKDGRIAELETELSSLRVAPNSRGPALERGGSPGGAYSARPDFQTASGSDLINAALQEAEQRRSRRAVGAR